VFLVFCLLVVSFLFDYQFEDAAGGDHRHAASDHPAAPPPGDRIAPSACARLI